MLRSKHEQQPQVGVSPTLDQRFPDGFFEVWGPQIQGIHLSKSYHQIRLKIKKYQNLKIFTKGYWLMLCQTGVLFGSPGSTNSCSSFNSKPEYCNMETRPNCMVSVERMKTKCMLLLFLYLTKLLTSSLDYVYT